ncbi:MAG: hypothetical protein V1750_08890 [Acidobacteriota bacterium]
MPRSLYRDASRVRRRDFSFQLSAVSFQPPAQCRTEQGNVSQSGSCGELAQLALDYCHSICTWRARCRLEVVRWLTRKIASVLRCGALRSIFSDLMPLGAPTGDALRRALVQPALKCGYRFEDEALVAEMLQAVEGERGALPLLAFAAASLWDRRDREHGLLTRAAHEAIGGVAGALAQHAEGTLARVGTDKLPLVRELFRNLVTAQGTRAVRDVDELLTVFPEGSATMPRQCCGP